MQILQSIILGAVGGIVCVIVYKSLEKRIKSSWIIWLLTIAVSCAIVTIPLLLFSAVRIL